MAVVHIVAMCSPRLIETILKNTKGICYAIMHEKRLMYKHDGLPLYIYRNYSTKGNTTIHSYKGLYTNVKHCEYYIPCLSPLIFTHWNNNSLSSNANQNCAKSLAAI